MAIKHTIRNNKNGTKKVTLTPRTAILAFCYECMNFNYYEIEKCTTPLCPLFPFRNRRATKGTREVSQKGIEAIQLQALKRSESNKKVFR